MALKNLPAYLNERFAPVNMILFAILFLTVFCVSQFGAEPLPSLTWVEAWGAVAVISFFYRLRVFDEHKDYAIDQVNHPDRVLQSGRITLRELTLVSGILTVAEAGWSVYMGGPVLGLWALAVGYSLLMRVEFFVGDWLKQRLTLYAITHMLIMPLIIAWLYRAYHASIGGSYWLLAALSLLAGFSFEVARKTHSADAERTTVDSYSKELGFRTSVATILLLLVVGTGVQYYLLSLLDARLWPYITLAVLMVGTLGLYLKNLRSPQESSLRKAELAVSLFMLISYVSIIIEAYW